MEPFIARGWVDTQALTGCRVFQEQGKAYTPGPWTSFFPRLPLSHPLQTKSCSSAPQVTFATETHPSSDSSFFCRGLKRVGTYRAIPQLSLCPPRILTPTPQSLSPMARKMVLPQEEPCSQQCLRRFPMIALQLLSSPHCTACLMALPYSLTHSASFITTIQHGRLIMQLWCCNS